MLDAESFEHARRIMNLLTHHEFPWDSHEVLSFALVRTYAVPRLEQLQLKDIADAIAYMVTRPRRAAVNELFLRPSQSER